MNLILGGISILIGLVVGNISAAYISLQANNITKLCDAVETLKIHICSYSSGLCQAIEDGKLAEKCVLFGNIQKSAANTGSIDAFIYAVNNSPYNSDIKTQLIRLFQSISKSEENDIRTNFDITLSVIEKYKSEALEKKEKNSPLYKKIGILAGIGVAILLL